MPTRCTCSATWTSVPEEFLEELLLPFLHDLLLQSFVENLVHVEVDGGCRKRPGDLERDRHAAVGADADGQSVRLRDELLGHRLRERRGDVEGQLPLLRDR